MWRDPSNRKSVPGRVLTSRTSKENKKRTLGRWRLKQEWPIFLFIRVGDITGRGTRKLEKVSTLKKLITTSKRKEEINFSSRFVEAGIRSKVEADFKTLSVLENHYIMISPLLFRGLEVGKALKSSKKLAPWKV